MKNRRTWKINGFRGYKNHSLWYLNPYPLQSDIDAEINFVAGLLTLPIDHPMVEALENHPRNANKSNRRKDKTPLFKRLR